MMINMIASVEQQHQKEEPSMFFGKQCVVFAIIIWQKNMPWQILLLMLSQTK